MKGSVTEAKVCPPASDAKAMSRTATVPRTSRTLGSLRGDAKARSKWGDGMDKEWMAGRAASICRQASYIGRAGKQARRRWRHEGKALSTRARWFRWDPR